MAIYPFLLHRLDTITLYSYSLSLKSQGKREGLLIHHEERDRWAEAAPLPGRSRETFSQARDQLLRFFSSPQEELLYPSVQFALESLFDPPLPLPLKIPVWTLLAGGVEEILEEIKNPKSTHIKIKISQLSIPDAKKVLEHLDPSLHWRIDCNRAFSLNQAIEIFSQNSLPHLCIEEPLYDLKTLTQFPFPFALDETLEEFPNFPIQDFPNLSTLILKPMIHGGKKGCQDLLMRAQKNNLSVIFTGAYESGIGTLQIVSLAQKLQKKCVPLGLGTYSFLEEDLLPLNFNSAGLKLENYPPISLKHLTEIAHGTCHLPSF